MAKDKKLVEQITSMEDDFAQWYTRQFDSLIDPYTALALVVSCELPIIGTTRR